MCLWDRTPTLEETRVSFVTALAIAINTGVFRDALYCDLDTNYALCDLAQSWPAVTQSAVDLAWAAFEGQFNGVNAAKRKVWWDTTIARCMKEAGWIDADDVIPEYEIFDS